MSKELIDTLRDEGFEVIEVRNLVEAVACLSIDTSQSKRHPKAWVYGENVLMNDTLGDLARRVTSQRTVFIYRPDEPEDLEAQHSQADTAMEMAELRWKLDDVTRQFETLAKVYQQVDELSNEIKLKDLHIERLAADLLDVAEREEQLKENGGYVYQQWTYAKKLIDEANEEKYELQVKLINEKKRMRTLMSAPLTRVKEGIVNTSSP